MLSSSAWQAAEGELESERRSDVIRLLVEHPARVEVEHTEGRAQVVEPQLPGVIERTACAKLHVHAAHHIEREPRLTDGEPARAEVHVEGEGAPVAGELRVGTAGDGRAVHVHEPPGALVHAELRQRNGTALERRRDVAAFHREHRSHRERRALGVRVRRELHLEAPAAARHLERPVTDRQRLVLAVTRDLPGHRDDREVRPIWNVPRECARNHGGPGAKLV